MIFGSYNIDPDTVLIVGAPNVEENQEMIYDLLREKVFKIQDGCMRVL